MKLFILGSTGDLVRRKVLPALNELKEPTEIVALGRESLNDSEYTELMKIPNFRKRINYIQVDFEKGDLFNPCLTLLDKNKVNFFYVPLPPFLLEKVFTEFGKLRKLGYQMKILVEKPFGTSLSNAEALNLIIKKYNIDVSISDHYLFKKNVLSLTKTNFSKLKIVVLEKLGLEGRASYYDTAGALKDMIQNHFLNMTFKLFDDFSDFKIIKNERKQYEGYEEELGKKSDTETFVHLVIESKGKTFEFVTGKAFDSKKSYIEIDGERIDIDTAENPYVEIFKRFLNSETASFPNLKHTFLAWKIIDSIPKTKLGHYKKGTTFQSI